MYRTHLLTAPSGIAGNVLTPRNLSTSTPPSMKTEIFLNANSIRLGNLPMGSFSPSSAPSSSATRQTIYELCVCPNGKLYLSPAGAGSTCQSSSNICLWS
ncbi:hypothetical protein lerEdw1_012103 [Lerista edwardsae]|nr:hypothetical protein lerEdw1_012103 [Lerista edwardsae]